jgi:hypothetical protein
MTTTYTADRTLKSIHFLNDRNIAQELSGDSVPKFNAIPSITLLEKETGKLRDELKTTVEALSVDDTAEETKFITKVSQESGKISVDRKQPEISDVSGLDTELTGIKDGYLKKEDFGTTLTANSKEFLSDGQIGFEHLDLEGGKHVLRLKNKKTEVTLDIDCSLFVKDGMVKEVKVNYEGDAEHTRAPYLVITWNDDAGGSVTWLSVQDILHDIYKVKDEDDGIQIKNYEVSLNYDRVTDRAVFDPVKEYVTELQGTSGGNPGIIKELQDDVSTALQNDIRQMKFDGKIIHVVPGDSIRTVLKKNQDIAVEDQVRNNSFYLIKMEDEGYAEPTSEFETSDGFVLRNGDLVVIHDADASKVSIPLDTLLNENIHIFKMGVDFKEFNNEVSERKEEDKKLSDRIDTEISVRTAEDKKISDWLVKQFNADGLNPDIAELEIKKNIKANKDLSIDASNLKYTEGYTAEQVTLSVENLSSHIDGLDGTFVTGSQKKISKITQEDGKLSVEYSDLISSDVVGIDTFVNDKFADLSTEIDRKISIGKISGTTVDVKQSDLSVVKINYADYKNLVIEGRTSEGCIYIISDDYDDAMGHQLCNLTMPGDKDYIGVATTKPYVDEQIATTTTSMKTTINGIIEEVQNQLSNFTDANISNVTLDDVFKSMNLMYNALGKIKITLS